MVNLLDIPEERTWYGAGEDAAQKCLDHGLVMAVMGDLTGAIVQYRRALALEPDSATGHYLLGVALMATHKVDEAHEQWRKVLRSRQSGSKADWARSKAEQLL